MFEPAYRKHTAIEILNELCVRRFRRLEGKTKHEYRQEISEGVEMQHLRERLFFAAYHKGLVKSKAEAAGDDQKAKADNPYRVLFGYLEGFEFLPQSNDAQKINKSEVTDFHHQDDSNVIVKLSSSINRYTKFDLNIRNTRK
ncbi:MAG: hypothetical protein IPP15_16200 [Saprospiraceae bacterium]|uniref:Uncharacterized protein n=1 Tax=Candidatus Opimibacter skivensis TaxID=2982028 RepID=A0A9D7SY96_9BACT|nr:hypothetical protein [Candidatus Opimibacter skivensis]